MYRDQGESVPQLSAEADGGRRNGAEAELAQLVGTVVSGIDFGDGSVLDVKGCDRDGEARWRLKVRGSARFTFSHGCASGSWLVEANFDAGGTVRGSERTMILAMCGAAVDAVRVEEEGLFICSGDGRGIELPYALNEEGVAIDILSDGERSTPRRIVLPG